MGESEEDEDEEKGQIKRRRHQALRSQLGSDLISHDPTSVGIKANSP